MERKYPVKYFVLFVFTNFIFHFFYLFLAGILLCIAGIWSKVCLWLGLAVLLLDLILSVIEQLRLRKTAVTPSDNQDFNDLMDAFCGPGGMEAVRKVAEEKIKAAHTTDSPGEESNPENR